MSLATLNDGSELQSLYFSYSEGINIITRIKAKLDADIATMKADANYNTEATAGEKSAIDANQTAIGNLAIT